MSDTERLARDMHAAFRATEPNKYPAWRHVPDHVQADYRAIAAELLKTYQRKPAKKGRAT